MMRGKVKDIISAFNKVYPNRVVGAIAEYEGCYLIAAPQKDLKGRMDHSNGFFLMTKDTRSIRHFDPIEDVVGFQRALINDPIYRDPEM